MPARRLLGGFTAASCRARPPRLCSGSAWPRCFECLDLGQSAVRYAEDLIERMNPRDPAEEMLVVQMLLAHVRALHLTSLANDQLELDQLRVTHEYADRASNTYRRLMLALSEYRRSPRAGDSFTAIQQASIAGQQVVLLGTAEQPENATNEQEIPNAHRNPPPDLQVDAGGPGSPPQDDSEDQAVGTLHGAANPRGQGSKRHERLAAR